MNFNKIYFFVILVSAISQINSDCIDYGNCTLCLAAACSFWCNVGFCAMSSDYNGQAGFLCTFISGGSEYTSSCPDGSDPCRGKYSDCSSCYGDSNCGWCYQTYQGEAQGICLKSTASYLCTEGNGTLVKQNSGSCPVPTTQFLTTQELTTQPVTTQPLTTQELTTQPLTTQELTTQPLTTQELTTQPMTTQELTTQPLTTQELTTQPLTTQELTTQELTTHELTTQELTTDPLTTRNIFTTSVKKESAGSFLIISFIILFASFVFSV